MLPYALPNARRCLDDAIRLLGPDVRDQIAQAQAAVDDAVLSHRIEMATDLHVWFSGSS